MTIDLDAIEQAARAATPGPWRVDAVERIVGPERIRDHGMGPEDDPVVIVETDGGYYPPEPPDLAYLLAATPSTVLALVARVRELEAAVQVAHDALDYDLRDTTQTDHAKTANMRAWQALRGIKAESERLPR